MIFNEQLKSWYAKFQKYTVKYKDGFFHISNLSNSPRTMVESFGKASFVKHSAEKKLISSKTLFLNLQVYYAEVEKGLWILVSEMKLKKNMVMHNLLDESMPINYNFINLHYNQQSLVSKSMLVNGMMHTDKTWSVFKAGKGNSTYHFKGSHEFNITIYFTDEWLEEHRKSKAYFKDSNFDKFFKSDNTYVFIPDISLNTDKLYQDFLSLIEINADYSKNKEIKKLITVFFKQFICKYDLETINDNHFKLADKDRKHIQKTEKYLLDNLLNSFPGIETIAQKIGISPTKLKTDFKIIHNQSLYHYYRYHQMHLASKLLSEKASTVKEVANLLGYENASKFAAVFKEQFGILPSSLVKERVV